MTRRAVRFALFIVFLAAVGAAGWFLVDAVREADRDQMALVAIDHSARSALGALGDARMALQAHTSPDQSVVFWRKRLTDEIQTLESKIVLLRQQAGEDGGLNDVDAAAAAVAELSSISARVARLASAGEGGDVSRAVYGEAIEALSTAAMHINSGWDAERSAFDVRQHARLEAAAYRGLAAMAAALLAVVLLLPTGRRQRAVNEVRDVVSHDLPLSPPAMRADPVPSQAASVAATEPASSRGGFRPDRRKAVELRAMADLCTDFARLEAPAELPALLERTAGAIDAAGFIVWVANSEGTELTPALAHGYSPEALARVPAIPRGADNATAAAWRSSEMQVVKTVGTTPGALAMPLLTADGCIGVFAAELRHLRESSESVRALARIVASQLAALLSPPLAAQPDATINEPPLQNNATAS